MRRTALIIVDVQNDFLPAHNLSERDADGALAVPSGNDVIPVIQSLLSEQWEWTAVVASQDYHPPAHISFASRHAKPPFTELEVTDGRGRTYAQTLWPDHCVQGTRGAEIDKQIRASFGAWKGSKRVVRKVRPGMLFRQDIAKLTSKACMRDVEAYSAFEGYVTTATEPSEPPESIEQSLAADAEMTRFLRDEGVERVVITGLATDFCVHQTTLDALRARFDTALLVPGTKAVYADRVQSVCDEVREEGGAVIGVEGGWTAELREWLRE